MDRYHRLRKALIFCLSALVSIQIVALPLSSDYAARPPLLNQSSEPLVMLVMSVDHELFKKAYPDYSDLDSDGQLDTTYNDSFEYLGYFESNWCYSYNGNDHYYESKKQATGANSHYCNPADSYWSGNFLNWATMSRIDILRRVLYGGKRSKDTSTETILERADLLRDIHAFAKVYQGSDVAQLTPYNTDISLCNLTQTSNGDPLVRITSGVWKNWASRERKQCQWNDSGGPYSFHKLEEHQVRVKSCINNLDAPDSDRCRYYASGNYKPSGLLQRYGEDGTIKFGLLSGSYGKNISGGVLRRNISKIGGNNFASEDELDTSTGVFNSSVKGIIHHVNTFKLVQYNYTTGIYSDCSSPGISVSQFKSASSNPYSSRHCSNWGNPVAELYLEALRYFSGASSPTSTFYTSFDSTYNLYTESWSDPVSAANACSNCSIILLSTGLNSFDFDELASSSDIPGLTGTTSVITKTNEVGNLEYNGQFAGNYLSGGTGSTRQCDQKYLTGLFDAKGICPDIPQLEGSYAVSGLAFHANKTDLRSSLTGVQNVKTYAIQLAESVPNFTLNVDGSPVTFQPVCQSNGGGGWIDCTLVDVEILSLDASGKEGSFLLTWEDSLWGFDFDFDASSEIQFCIGSQCALVANNDLRAPGLSDNELRFAVTMREQAAGFDLRFSYTVTGASDENSNNGLQTDFAYKNQANNFKVHQYSGIGSAASILPQPLYLASKYGGFVDLDGDGTPDNSAGDNREWDSRNNLTGAIGSDNLPDNYFFARNPVLLDAQLGQVLKDISSRVTSATNAALFANSSNGTGALYQALFQPSQDLNGKTIEWGGLLHALFVDSKGYLREDGNGNDQLDDYSTDKIVELMFDPNAGQTMVQRYTSNDNGVTRTVFGSLASLSSLATIWDARKQLSDVSDVLNQRTYTSVASGGRHILTWLDADNDQVVDTGETQPFTTAAFSGQEGYLGISSSEVSNLVHYLRGEEQSDARNRSIDFDGDGLTDTWRLGDIVHSTPRMVAAPNSRFDAYYKDSSYKTFLEQYQNRRQVIYVGANDGFIHAFNGGFWDESSHSYERTGGNSEVQHPLGSELWAYAPMNLLPHLQWLREVDYPHVYYMDGEPLVFDANIFADDTDHPGGWGTLLVMGMRLGGGAIDVSIGGSTRTMRSAYVVLDITNPEKPPELLAEITHPDLGFTTSTPELIKFRKAGTNGDGSENWLTPEQNDWYLVFGSGPGGAGSTATRDALDNGKSSQNLGVFIYDLKSKAMVSGFDPLMTSYSQSYAGDMTVKDWNQDYQDDVVYFGSVDTTNTSLGGQLLRFKLGSTISNSSLGVLLNAGQPIVAKPLAVADKRSFWVYSGTGRLLTEGDNRDASANYFYGVQEPTNSLLGFTYNSVNASSLIDTTSVEVLIDGTVRIPDGSSYTGFTVGSSVINDFSALQEAIKNQSGWKRALSYDGVNPSGRNVNTANQLFSLILFSEYQPPADSCSVDGNSYLYAVNYLTGTAEPIAPLGTIPVEDVETPLVLERVSLGIGFSSSPVIHQGEKGKITAVTQGAGGSITGTDLNYQFSSEGRQSWWQIFKFPWTE